MKAILSLLDWKQMSLIGSIVFMLLGLSFAAGTVIGHIRGSTGSKVDCAENKVTAMNEGKKRDVKIQKKNARLDDDALDRKWCSFVLDTSFDECVQRNQSIRP